jgi:hypothetical protein
MNSRKIVQNLNNSDDFYTEERVSNNMSIDEDSFKNDHPSSAKKIFFNSLDINNILSENLNQFPTTGVCNTQKQSKNNIPFLLSENSPLNNFDEDLPKKLTFTSKKRKKSKKKNKKKEKDDDESAPHRPTTTKILNEIIENLNTFNYSEYELKHFFDDNHLNLTLKTDPYIELKVLCTSENVDLRCVPNSYIIGENGLNCSMKNHNRDVTTIGRQQINADMIRPNDIMLFPTDSSLSRCHLTIYHKIFFDELKKYKEDVDITIRISRKSKYNYLPQQIWYGIIHFLRPKLCLEIQDQGTIYGSYVKINEMSVFNFLINAYIILSDSRTDLFSFFKSDFMYINSNRYNNDIINNYPFVNGDLTQINSMQINLVIQKIYYELKKNSPIKICNYIKDYLNHNLNYILNNPYGDTFAYETLFNQVNKILKPNQFYLTSNHSGIIIENIGTLGQILENIIIKYNNYQNMYQNSDSVTQISVSLLSIGKICNAQKIEQNSKIFSANFNSVFDMPNIEEFDSSLNEKAIQMIETEGDPCGVMNHIRIIILVDTLFKFQDNYNSFSILFQRGFTFGRNKYTCLYCPLFDCNVFIYYSIQAKTWAINEISNLFNSGDVSNNNFNNEQYFGLYLCTSDDKGFDDRFRQKKYYVSNGDKIKISDTVLEVKYHV